MSVLPHHGWNNDLTGRQMKIYDVIGNDVSDYYPNFPGRFYAIFSDPEAMGKVRATGGGEPLHREVARRCGAPNPPGRGRRVRRPSWRGRSAWTREPTTTSWPASASPRIAR
jgi:hypothetical protein